MEEAKKRDLPDLRGMVLAAGHGTRMGSLSTLLPKPLLPVCGLPLIRYSLAHLGEAGLRDVVVNLHHLGGMIKEELGECGGIVEDFLQNNGKDRARTEESGNTEENDHLKYVGRGGNGPYGLNVYYSEEKGDILGTGGGIKKVRDFFSGSTFVVFNGKIVCNLDVARAVAFHKKMGALATMVLRPEPDPYSWGAVETDGDGWIQTIAGAARPESFVKSRASATNDEVKAESAAEQNRDNKDEIAGTQRQKHTARRIWSKAKVPVKGYVFTGIHIMEPEFLDVLGDGPSCIVRDGYFKHLRQGAPLAGFVHEGYWQDHSTPARYVQGNMRVLDWQTGLFENTGFPDLNGIQEETEISDDAVIVPPVLICKGAKVGAGARIGPGAVIGKDAVVRENKVVSNAVVWDGAEVDADAVSAVVTPHGVVQVNLSDMGAKTGPALSK